jgi:arginine decarboxylase
MSTIRVVSGVGTGPTETAAYDAALAAANVHNYNLVAVSSVVPADATVEVVETAPDLGPAGDRLTVVEARATTADADRVAAALGWATGPGPGLFYESAGETDARTVRDRVERGLAAGRDLREWTFEREGTEVAATEAAADGHTAAVVLAAYGRSRPVF